MISMRLSDYMHIHIIRIHILFASVFLELLKAILALKLNCGRYRLLPFSDPASLSIDDY